MTQWRRVDGQKSEKRPLRLRCSVQNYDWGIPGHTSQVARLFSLNSGSEIDPKKPYAEFWIGTHESGPSFVDHVGQNGAIVVGTACESLKTWISRNPNALGDKILRKWGTDLPFLFKVLSVRNALSIQVHPDKECARTLHKSQPSFYKDENHKPEMALAVTEFEALCGFISRKELKEVLCSVPEIIELVGEAYAEKIICLNGQDEAKAVLEYVFGNLLLASQDRISEAISKLKRRLQSDKKRRHLTDKEQLVLRLERQYPADSGVLAAFLLNYVKLNRGEALYLGPNEPHAYIHGECIECMATSDNVVRAGLTSKHRDIRTLLSMLTYKQGYPEILHGVLMSKYTMRYVPPFDEFEVDRSVIPRGKAEIFQSVPGPSLFIFIAGRGTIITEVSEKQKIKEGDVIFVPADMEMAITAETSELELYRAGVNTRVFQHS